MTWAWEQSLPPTSKLLLMALADIADDAGACWPRIRTLALKCCISERTVQRTLKQFEALDLLEIKPRFTAGGGQTSSAYQLRLSSPPDKLSPPRSHGGGESDTGDTRGVTKPCHPRGDIALSPQEPPHQSPTEPPLPLHYPPMLPLSSRPALCALLDGTPASDAQLLLDELVGVLASGNTIRTTPIRWFRGLVQRYQEGRFTPTEGIVVAEKRRNAATGVWGSAGERSQA